jgi:hypothetical protein
MNLITLFSHCQLVSQPVSQHANWESLEEYLPNQNEAEKNF